MRIAVVTSSSFFSYLLLSDIISDRHDEFVAMIVMQPRVAGKGLAASVAEVHRKTGWGNMMLKVLTRVTFTAGRFFSKLGIVRHCVAPEQLAARVGIAIMRASNCNDPAVIDFLRQKDIDILLSVNVYQRMREEILAVPRIAAVNTHFGLLPQYKGVSPYVWAMSRNEKQIGLSVHRMVYNFDEGKLLRQEAIPLARGDSAMGVYHRGCLKARKMISEAVALLERDPSAGFDQVGEGSYFSMPTRQCISDLKKNGYYLWRLRDLWFIFKSQYDGERLP